MDIDKSYERKIGIIERELGDKLFFLLWFATLIQLCLILWEWIDLVPAFRRLINLPWANEIKALELSTTGYLIIQLAYMGKKEITRWVRKTESVLQADEYIRRIRKGDVAVLIWGVLYLAAILCVALHIIERMPAELSRTFIQVATLYTCAIVSKTAFKGRLRPTSRASEFAGTQGLKPGMAMDDTTDKEKELLEFIKEKNTVNVRDCIIHSGLAKSTVNLMLKNMGDSGLIVREGGSKYVTYSINKRAVDNIKGNPHEEKEQ